jgi:hypothetical protein
VLVFIWIYRDIRYSVPDEWELQHFSGTILDFYNDSYISPKGYNERWLTIEVESEGEVYEFFLYDQSLKSDLNRNVTVKLGYVQDRNGKNEIWRLNTDEIDIRVEDFGKRKWDVAALEHYLLAGFFIFFIFGFFYRLRNDNLE